MVSQELRQQIRDYCSSRGIDGVMDRKELKVQPCHSKEQNEALQKHDVHNRTIKEVNKDD